MYNNCEQLCNTVKSELLEVTQMLPHLSVFLWGSRNKVTWFKNTSYPEFIKPVFPTSSSLFHMFPHLFLQFSLKTTGIYKATISDDRGKDMSQIDVSGKGKHSLFIWANLSYGLIPNWTVGWLCNWARININPQYNDLCKVETEKELDAD